MFIRRKSFLAPILVLFLAFPVWAGTSFSGKVVAVLDGDTIDVMHQGRAERIRLEGVDCPEKRQAFGNKAKQFTADLVMGKKVTVIAQKKDRYDRDLRLRDPAGRPQPQPGVSPGGFGLVVSAVFLG